MSQYDQLFVEIVRSDPKLRAEAFQRARQLSMFRKKGKEKLILGHVDDMADTASIVYERRTGKIVDVKYFVPPARALIRKMADVMDKRPTSVRGD
jgi:hypothetical protein